jgi:hypothetical protein
MLATVANIAERIDGPFRKKPQAAYFTVATVQRYRSMTSVVGVD